MRRKSIQSNKEDHTQSQWEDWLCTEISEDQRYSLENTSE